jgi:hypothetical protein
MALKKEQQVLEDGFLVGFGGKSFAKLLNLIFLEICTSDGSEDSGALKLYRDGISDDPGKLTRWMKSGLSPEGLLIAVKCTISWAIYAIAIA